MKHTQFLILGSMIVLGNLMIGSTSAALSINNNYQINGPYANSGFITDGDSIHYAINYSGVNADISGGIIAEYNGAIGTGACFSNISLSSSGSITFFDENNQPLSGGLDCTTRSFSAILYKPNSKISIKQGQSVQWYGYINNNLEANYQDYNVLTNLNELYIWDGNQSILIDQGDNMSWSSNINSYGQSIYQKYDSSINNNELYYWNGTQSILVDSGTNIYWQSSFSNSSKFNYQKYNSLTNEYEMYIWDGTQSILVDSGVNTYWSSSLNENGQGIYQKYNPSTNLNEFYIWDGNQSIFVDSGSNGYWQSTLNNNMQATYQKYNYSTNLNELYIWNGSQSIFVDSGNSANWQGGIINQNNQANYQKYNTNTNEYELYYWNGNQSIFVSSGVSASWNGAINNNGQIQYRKYNSSTNLNEFYIWDGGQSILIASGNSISWASNITNNGEAQYRKYNPTTSLYELYYWDGNQSLLLEQEAEVQRYGYMDDYGHIQYQKYNNITLEQEIYIVDTNTQINSTIEYEISIQSGVTQNNIPYITTTGTYNNELSGNNFVHQHTIYYPTNSSAKFAGGTSNSIQKDNCPNGDNSSSYYDNTCEQKNDIATGNITIQELDINNTTITDGYCYKRKDTAVIQDSNIFTTSKEFKQALEFMYIYGMTIHNSIDEFKPNDNLTREQAAKIFTNFATNVLCRSSGQDDKSIDYLDIQDADANLVPYIRQAYTLGLMKGSKDNKFRPKDTITKAELNATIIRMILQSDLPEDTGPTRYDEYNKVSQNLGIIKKQADNSPVIRKFASLMFFRAYKNQSFSLQKINDTESFVLDSRDKFIQ